MNNKQILIYTDGSSKGNPGRGGWAAILYAEGKTKEISGGFRMTTNNRMEIMAVIKGLEALETRCNNVTIFTDSKLVSNAINDGWLKSWIKKNWKKADKKPVLNVDLWKQLISLLEKHNVKFIWIEGHVGVYGNEKCDLLCKKAADIATEIDFEYENSVKRL